MTVAWLSQEVCYLESTIFAYSAASLTITLEPQEKDVIKQ